MMKLTLSNNFHNSEVTLNVNPSFSGSVGYISLSVNQTNRAKKELCGVKSCSCSNGLGMRGNVVLLDGKDIDVEYVDVSDDGAEIRFLNL